MARRMKKAESQLMGVFILFGLIAVGINKVSEHVGWDVVAVICGLLLLIYAAIKLLFRELRRSRLMRKYNDSEIVTRLMKKTIWQGQTAEQLIDALGKPRDIDQKVLKTKKKETWKYNHQGANRYGLRVVLDDDRVIGWDNKD